MEVRWVTRWRSCFHMVWEQSAGRTSTLNPHTAQPLHCNNRPPLWTISAVTYGIVLIFDTLAGHSLLCTPELSEHLEYPFFLLPLKVWSAHSAVFTFWTIITFESWGLRVRASRCPRHGVAAPRQTPRVPDHHRHHDQHGLHGRLPGGAEPGSPKDRRVHHSAGRGRVLPHSAAIRGGVGRCRSAHRPTRIRHDPLVPVHLRPGDQALLCLPELQGRQEELGDSGPEGFDVIIICLCTGPVLGSSGSG